MPLLISRNDITKIDVDAIVNASNTQLKMGGGVSGAIFKAAGAQLQEACNKLAPIKIGQAVITDGFESNAKYIIHAAGPIYQVGNQEQEKQLYDCYHNSLQLAADKHLETIAFPLISSGVYGYPSDEALTIAQTAIHDFLGSYEGEMTVYLLVYNDDAFKTAQSLCGDVKSYIDERFIDDDIFRRRMMYNLCEESLARPCPIMPEKSEPEPEEDYEVSSGECFEVLECQTEGAVDKEDIFANLEDSFSDLLFKMIRKKQMTNADVYKNANLDRRLFSKIISNKDYTPRKNTVFALAISLKLNLEETQNLLRSAGYAISHSSKADLIIEYYITHPNHKQYNIDDLNFLLFKYNQVQLGQIE